MDGSSSAVSFNFEVPMNFRRLRLIVEALFWVPVAVVAAIVLHFARLVHELLAAFRAEWDDADDAAVSKGRNWGRSS